MAELAVPKSFSSIPILSGLASKRMVKFNSTSSFSHGDDEDTAPPLVGGEPLVWLAKV
jgi:hypothetical protein